MDAGYSVKDYIAYLPPKLRGLSWQPHPLDGKLLLFDRDTGLNVLLEGEETASLQRLAPRTALIAVTNVCNLTCNFCYRDLQSRSIWDYDTLMDFCQALDRWGVLEVAFGGGEPMLFPRWDTFIRELYTTTKLCINFTTNGVRLTKDFLNTIAGCYGNIRVSLYEDNHWRETITLLTSVHARFGVNWLITPQQLGTLDAQFHELLHLGVTDFLFLSYKGEDRHLHLSPDERHQFSTFIERRYRELGGAVQMKLDACWGNSLPAIPRLHMPDDCGAGDDFIAITSDKHLKGCSFQSSIGAHSFETVEDLRALWQAQRQVKEAVLIGGCARLPQRGLVDGLVERKQGAIIDLASIL